MAGVDYATRICALATEGRALIDEMGDGCAGEAHYSAGQRFDTAVEGLKLLLGERMTREALSKARAMRGER